MQDNVWVVNGGLGDSENQKKQKWSVPPHERQHKSDGFDPLAPSDIGAADSLHKSHHSIGGDDELSPDDIGAETPIEAQNKADIAEDNAKAYSDALFSNVYTKSESNSALAAKSDITHNHDARYYTATQLMGGVLDSVYVSASNLGTAIDDMVSIFIEGTLPIGASDLVYESGGENVTSTTGIVYI